MAKSRRTAGKLSYENNEALSRAARFDYLAQALKAGYDSIQHIRKRSREEHLSAAIRAYESLMV